MKSYSFKKVTIFDLVKMETGSMPPNITNKKWYSNNGIPFIKVRNISKDSKLIDKNLMRMSKESLRYLTIKSKGEVIFPRNAFDIGKVAFLDYDVAIDDKIYGLTSNDDIYAKYLYYYLISKSYEIKAKSKGTTISTLKRSDILSLVIKLPNIKYQERVSNLLDSIDLNIENRIQLKDKYINLRDQLIKDLISGKMKLEENIMWTKYSFDDISQISNGTKLKGVADIKWYESNSNWNYGKISNLNWNEKYIYSTNDKLSKEGVNYSRIVAKNSVILSTLATIGNVLINKTNLCVDNHMTIFSMNNKANFEFIYYLLKTLNRRFLDISSGTSFKSLKISSIRKMEINLPNISYQEKISNILIKIDKQIDKQIDLIDTMKTYKDTLIKKLINGDILLK